MKQFDRIAIYTDLESDFLPPDFPSVAKETMDSISDVRWSKFQREVFVCFCLLFSDRIDILQIYLEKVSNGSLPYDVAQKMHPDFVLPHFTYYIRKKVSADVRTKLNQAVPDLVYID